MNHEYEYKRALVFFERQVLVHASTNNFWCNGIILEVNEEFFVIKDRKDGDNKFIYFSELKKSLTPFKEVGE